MPQPAPTPWPTYLLGALCLLAVVAAVLVVGPSSSGGESAGGRTVTVAQGVVQSTVSGSGNIAAASQLDLGFKTAGVVTHIYVTQGAHVTAGQLLAELNPQSAEVALEQARATLQSAEAKLIEEEETDGEGASSAGSSGSGRAAAADTSADSPTAVSAVYLAASDTSRATNATTDESSTATPTHTTTPTPTHSPTQTATPEHPSTNTAAPEHPSTNTAAPEHPSTNTATPEHPSTNTATPEHPSTNTATPEHPSTNTATPEHPSTNTATPEHPSTNTATPEHPSTNTATPEHPSTNTATPEHPSTNTATPEHSSTEATTTSSGESTAKTTISPALREANIASARASVKSDKLAVQSAEESLADTRLFAPKTGTIVSLSGEVGETVSGGGTSRASSTSSGSGSSSSASAASASAAGAGGASAAGGGFSGSGDTGSSSSTFAVLSELSSMQLVVALSESEVLDVHPGQPATVTVEALESRKLAAHVVSVATLPTSSSGVVSYDVTFALDQLEGGLKPGMSATAEVVVKQAEGVNVPTTAISADTVTVVQNGKDVRRRVVTGLAGNSSTIILSGLKAGEQIVLPVARATTSAGSLSSRLGSRLGGAAIGGGAALGGGGGAAFFGSGGGGFRGG